MQLDSKLCTCGELKLSAFVAESCRVLHLKCKSFERVRFSLFFSVVAGACWSCISLGLISACFHNGAPEKALQALQEVKSLPNCDGSGPRLPNFRSTEAYRSTA